MSVAVTGEPSSDRELSDLARLLSRHRLAPLDPGRARQELHTLVRAVFGASSTATIQAPLLALAWELVAAASPDAPTFVADGLPQLRLHYDWLAHSATWTVTAC